jgi:Flp pilus assembly protein CpaB
MATITTAAVSRVNRRFLLLAIILGILAAVLVYAQMSRSDSKGGTSAGTVSVVVASSDIAAGTRITAAMVDVRSFTEDNVGFQALNNPQQAIGQTVRYPLAAGEQVLSSKLVDTTISSSKNLTYILPAGTRGVAIRIDDVTGAGGLVLPGDHVDIVWVPLSDGPAYVLFSDIEVTAVGQAVVDVAPAAPGLQQDTTETTDGQRIRISEGSPDPDATTMTLMVTPEQMTALVCSAAFAQGNGGSTTLAVRSFGDTAPVAPNAPACPPTDLLRQFKNQPS